MATIVKRGDSWRAQIRRSGFKTLSASFSRKVLAEKWVREREAELDQGRFFKDDPDFGVLVQRYIDEVIPLRPMQRSHVATLRTLRRQVGGTPLSKVNPGWMLGLAESRKVAASTRGQEFVFLAMVLKHAETFWDVRPDMDAWRRGRQGLKKLGLIAASSERSRRASDEEIELVLDNMRSSLPMEDLIGFAVASAMRLSEITRVTWADFDQKRKLLTIRDRKHPSKKKGNDQTIPLLGAAFEIAAAQPKWRKEIFPHDPNSISAAFHRATVRAGIEDLRWHDLRHEGISRLFEQGFSIEKVALISGHRDWRILRRYTHLDPESLHMQMVG